MSGAGKGADPRTAAAADNGFGIAAYWWWAYVGAAAILLAALLSLALLFADSEARMVKRNLSASSAVLAHELGSRTAAVASQLQRWRDDDRLRAALLDGRSKLLRAKQEELALLVPDAIGVMLLTATDTLPGGGAGERLSFAGVEMVRKVRQTGQLSQLEAHRVNTDDEHLAISGPVMDAAGGRVLGVVHLMLPLSFLPRAGDMQSRFAQFHYRQRAGERTVVIDSKENFARPANGSQGDVSLTDSSRSGARSTRTPVDGTSLVLFARTEPRGLLSAERLPWVAGLYVTAVVLLGFAVWLPFRRQRRGIEADLASLAELAEDAANRRPLRPTRNRISEFLPVQVSLRRLLLERLPTPAEAPFFEANLEEPHPPQALSERDATASRPFQPGLDASVGPGPSVSMADRSEFRGASFEEDNTDQKALRGTHRKLACDGSASTAEAASPDRSAVPAGIFRAYDVRGLIGSEINADVMRWLGLAVGSEAREHGGSICIVARDQRPSGASLSAALIEGLRASACDVVDLGIAPTPVLYFAAHRRPGCSAAIVTASHNPARYNGLKVVIAGRSATAEQILALRERIQRSAFTAGAGDYRQDDVFDDYVAEIESDVAVARRMKVVIDCGHAAASLVAARLYDALGCDLVELDCDLEPALADVHMPDPSQPQNLYALGEAVIAAQADVGLAFDADGDRLGVVDSGGRFIAADRVLMLLAADVLARHPGSDIVYDVKCSHQLGSEILRHGGQPVMWRSGHSFLKEKMRELGAPLGGELSGHIVFGDRWNGFDDALYAGARVLEVLALDPRTSAEIFAELPSAIGTPELFVAVPGRGEHAVMEAVLGMAGRLDGVEVNTIDGLRAEFAQGWGLVRASNTQPGLVFRFQADDDASLAKIQGLFRRMLRRVAPGLELPF